MTQKKYFKSNNIIARPKGVYGEFDQEDLETIRLAEKAVQKEVASAQSQDRKNVREKIKEQHLSIMNDIVDKMSTGELTWRHFANVSAPNNGTSQSVYRGNNRLILGYMSAIRGYEDPRWYTFNQANTLGYSIEKGQKGTPIEIYKIWDKKEKKEVSYKELEKIFDGMSQEEKQKYYRENITTLAKQYTVFNGEQVKGLEKYVAPMLNEKDSNERCENVLNDVTCKIFYDEKDRAYYSTSKDEIHLPDRKDFNNIQTLYATAFHEIAHSTGHDSRLNRDMSGSFGDNKYAKEELIAELTSVFLQQDLGVKLGNREVENHAAYLQHWSKNAEGAEEFFKAAGSAENAATFILVKAKTAENSILATVEKTMESKQKSGTMEHIEIGDKDKMKEHDDKFSAMIYPVLNSGEKAQAINEELKPYLNRTVDIMTADAVLESVTQKHGIEIELKSDSKNSKVFLIDDRFFSIRFGILSNSNQDPVYKGFVDNDNDKCGIIEKINKTESAILCSEFHSNAEKKQARYNLENLIPALEQIKQVRLFKMVENQNASKQSAVKNENANIGASHEMAEIEKTEKVVSPSEYYRNKNLKRLEAIDKNIPVDMKKEPNWCAFKTYYNAETGKKRKVILSPKTSEWAKCNDSTTWSDYATAMEFAKAKNCEGLSFALESKNHIACIDLDHCINEKGMRSELCWDMLNASKGTYAEKSVSGTGMHIFFKGDNVLDGLNKHIESKGLECYDTAKFMSVTGNIVSKTNSLIECPEALKTKLTAELGSTQKSTRQVVSATPTNLSERELIEKISKSKVGKDFDDMFRNGTDLCGDLSRTDAKLMSMLSFFTGQDSAMMKSIFEQSALYRPDKKMAI